MGEVKHLTDKKEALDKLRSLAESVKVCMFCTNLDQLPISARPMNVREVDEHGNFWFISGADSYKNFEINHDNRVQLFFSKMSDSHYLSVFGSATIYRDKNKIEDIWTPIANTWFEEGKDDPNVTVIKVEPTDAYYWDTKDGRAVSLLKFAAAAVTGQTMDDGGVEGSMNV
jgi:general stress protein 26